MLNLASRIVLASFPGTVKREARNVKRGIAEELRPCWKSIRNIPWNMQGIRL